MVASSGTKFESNFIEITFSFFDLKYRVQTDRRTNMTRRLVTFHKHVANEPKIRV
jgi:hypothetical protein